MTFSYCARGEEEEVGQSPCFVSFNFIDVRIEDFEQSQTNKKFWLGRDLLEAYGGRRGRKALL